MKNGLLSLAGLFLALLTGWAGIVLGSHAQLGSLAPFFDEGEGVAHPQRTSGLAARGQLVYADLGCAACHTQQVRRPEFGNDKARGWGERQSVARDYIHQARPQLGELRFGPDLTNLAARKPEAPKAEALHRLLREGSATHPAYTFLYETVEQGAIRQIVPTERARSLVAYLESLNTAYDYPESRPLAKAAKTEAKK